MLFKELINNVNYDEVWSVLNREHGIKQGTYESYKQVFEELQSLEMNPCGSAFTLVVAKVEDAFEPGTFIFDVFGIQEGDENQYAIEMTPWNELITFNVLTKSIEIYGAPDVVAHALDEMTFFGYSATEVAQRVTEEKQILEGLHDEVESGTVQLLSYKEVMAKLGIVDNRTPEEKGQQLKNFERINAENKKVYWNLIGR